MTAAVRRRALLITKTDPRDARDGGTLRVAAVVAALQGAGWTVDVVPTRTASAGRRQDLSAVRGRRSVRAALRVAASGARVGSVSVARWIDPRVAARIAAMRAAADYDLAIVEFSQLLVYRPLLDGLPVLLDLHNVEAELLDHYAASAPGRGRRLAARWEASRLRRLEGTASLHRVDGAVTVSEREALMIARVAPHLPVRVAGNGVADEAFAVAKHVTDPPVVVFIAHLGWQPNVDAVRWLTEQVWPHVRAALPDARLQLVGRSPAAQVAALDGADGVSVRADVPSTLPYLAAAAVATAPLQAAGGTRLKILEALATGTPVVATPLGAMGLEHLEGAGLDIAADPTSFADRIVRRATRPRLPDDVRAGLDDHRWATTLAPLVALADALASGRRPAPGAPRPAVDADRPIDFELVIVSYRSRDEIEGLLAGLPATLPAVIVDNALDADGLRAFAASRPGTRYIDSGGGAGFARAANIGVRAATTDVVVLVNPDTRPTIETLRAIVDDVRADPSLVSSSPLNVSPSGRPELGAAGWEPTFGRALVHTLGLHKLFPRASYVARPAVGEHLEVDWVTGSCMAVSRDRFEALGAFDERYYVYNEDMALGHAARAHGMRQRLRTDLTVPHGQGGSGAPSTEMVRLKGASLRRYLLHRRPAAEAKLISAVLGSGFVVRAALFTLLRRPAKAREDTAFFRGILTGRATVGGRIVTDRE